jgi:hypothetical protein
MFDDAETTPLFSGSPQRVHLEAFTPQEVPADYPSETYLEDGPGSFQVVMRDRKAKRDMPLRGLYPTFGAAWTQMEKLETHNTNPHLVYLVKEVETDS